jgi:drug/metabolite transporter (DMT)-like permease
MTETTKKNLLLGVAFALLSAFMLAGMGLFAKKLSTYFGPFEVTFFRNAFAVIALFIWFLLARKLYLLKTDKPLMHLFRATIGTIGIVLGAFALSMRPLAETTVLLFTSPLFTVLLSYPVLGERVGIYRLSAVAIGFLGVVVMVNPFGESISSLPVLGVIVGLGWGFSSGMVDIWLRKMGRTENPNTTTFYFVLFGILSTGIHWPWAEIKPDSFSTPALIFIFGLGVTGLISLLAKTHSYKLGEASIIAPMMYTMIIWSMLFDYLFWGRMPTLNVIAGGGIIIACNIFILYREIYLKKSTQKFL